MEQARVEEAIGSVSRGSREGVAGGSPRIARGKDPDDGGGYTVGLIRSRKIPGTKGVLGGFQRALDLRAGLVGGRPV